MIKLVSKIFLYNIARHGLYNHALPFNYVFKVTERCNLRCRTCGIWQKKENAEFTGEEFRKMISYIGKSAESITITGGEPFLREDLLDIFKYIRIYSKPRVIIIATNGTLYDKIPELARKIACICHESKIVINISIDGTRDLHDFIRGTPGCYDNAIKTFKELKKMRKEHNLNFTIGINTILSKYNIDKLTEIYKLTNELKPDSFVVETAQHKDELNNADADIEPDQEKAKEAVRLAYNFDFNSGIRPVNTIKILRRLYYARLINILDNKPVNSPCYAGIASSYILPNTDIWACCVKARCLGNLRQSNYNIKDIYYSKKARDIIENIKNTKCGCKMANISYVNMLCSLKYLANIIWLYLKENICAQS